MCIIKLLCIVINSVQIVNFSEMNDPVTLLDSIEILVKYWQKKQNVSKKNLTDI